MKKKWLVALTITATTLLPLQATAAFTDVSDRYENAVEYIVDQGYANGLSESKFGVSNDIKRIDAAVMLARVNGFSPNGTYPFAGFTDVPKDRQWAVNALASKGIINGLSSKTFGSYQSMTRDQMAIVIAKSYELKAQSNKIPFTDVFSTVAPYVAALVENDITSGKTSTLFGSKQNITRGEFAIFIHKAESSSTEVPPEVISVE